MSRTPAGFNQGLPVLRIGVCCAPSATTDSTGVDWRPRISALVSSEGAARHRTVPYRIHTLCTYCVRDGRNSCLAQQGWIVDANGANGLHCTGHGPARSRPSRVALDPGNVHEQGWMRGLVWRALGAFMELPRAARCTLHAAHSLGNLSSSCVQHSCISDNNVQTVPPPPSEDSEL